MIEPRFKHDPDEIWWIERSRCIGEDPELFFPIGSHRPRRRADRAGDRDLPGVPRAARMPRVGARDVPGRRRVGRAERGGSTRDPPDAPPRGSRGLGTCGRARGRRLSGLTPGSTGTVPPPDTRRIAASSLADRASVIDQHVAEREPRALRDQRHQILLDLVGIGLVAEPESVRQPADVGVHGDALDDCRRSSPARCWRSCGRPRAA